MSGAAAVRRRELDGIWLDKPNPRNADSERFQDARGVPERRSMKQVTGKDQAVSRPQADRRLLQRQYASWFRRFVWNWYVTATFDREVSRAQAWALLKAYLNEVERDRRCCVAALMVMEAKWSGLGKPNSGYHFHLLLRTPPEITAAYLCQGWDAKHNGGRWCRQKTFTRCRCGQCEGGSMRCCSYDPKGNAADYLFKELHLEPDNWDLYRERLLGVEPKSFAHSKRGRRSLARHGTAF